MASITQTVPTYHAGISQQPDSLKIPGQVSVAQNVLPDITEGLMKRPGGRLVDSLSDHGTASNNSVTLGSPPVISPDFPDFLGILTNIFPLIIFSFSSTII